MSKALSIAELQKMNQEDLLKEISEQRQTVAKLRLAVRGGKEKGSHLYIQAKKQLAQMLTILSALRAQALKATVPTP